MDDDKFQEIARAKCDHCFRQRAEVDGCLLYKGRHAGMEECLGPFTDYDDRKKKFNDFSKSEEKNVDLDRIVRDVVRRRFEKNKKEFDN